MAGCTYLPRPRLGMALVNAALNHHSSFVDVWKGGEESAVQGFRVGNDYYWGASIVTVLKLLVMMLQDVFFLVQHTVHCHHSKACVKLNTCIVYNIVHFKDFFFVKKETFECNTT